MLVRELGSKKQLGVITIRVVDKRLGDGPGRLRKRRAVNGAHDFINGDEG